MRPTKKQLQFAWVVTVMAACALVILSFAVLIGTIAYDEVRERVDKRDMTPTEVWCYENPWSLKCPREPASDTPETISEEGCYQSGYDPESPYCAKETT
jgi:hypothetical protein